MGVQEGQGPEGPEVVPVATCVCVCDQARAQSQDARGLVGSQQEQGVDGGSCVSGVSLRGLEGVLQGVVSCDGWSPTFRRSALRPPHTAGPGDAGALSQPLGPAYHPLPSPAWPQSHSEQAV